ncbi:MAG: class II fructose-bisphosphatase [Peptostreptococcaceae bacterium]|nr:class II fructose-bisphosphatase [Peptostreptococcaceae bacterium]
MEDRNIALELVRITETAALASAKFMGRGDKNGADGAAVEGMRRAFENVNIRGEIVIGEGELDEAPMLYIGEKVGTGYGNSFDIAVDPLDGTSLIAKGLPNAIAVIAMAKKGCMLKAPDTYMDKIIVGPKAKGAIDITRSVTENLLSVARAMGKPVEELTATLLDRERHLEIMNEIREAGARIKVFNEGDIAGGIATCMKDSGVDILFGKGGAPEGVITAAAVKILGGDMQARLCPMSEQEVMRCREMGLCDEEVNKVLTMEDLVTGDDVYFAATGVTSGDFLKGVIYLGGNRAATQSVVMRASTGTIRFIDADHRLDKNQILIDLMKKYGNR